MRPMADGVQTHGITREAHRPNALLRGMAKHPELCFLLLSLLVTFLSNYGSSLKSKPLVIPAKMPQPLFPAMSPVMDMHLGDLRPLVDMLHQEDLIFVMYYAPWCAKSQAAIPQFLRAAEFLQGQVRFVAVNCWYPEGLCRQQYKFLLYPVFFAYHNNNDGYRYLGIERAEYMVKFLEDLLYPLILLTDIHQVKDFVAQHGTVVVGHFDFNTSPLPPGFQQFFYAAMRVVEHDPFQPVKFGVVTDPGLAALCHITQPSDIVFLRINNSTLKFSFPHNITSSNIVRWVFASRHQLPVRWIVPLGIKSLILSGEVSKGPVIIMFHRAAPLSTASQSFSVFKELSLRFHQCPRDELAWETTRRWGRLSLHNIFHHANLINQCRDSERWSTVLSDTFKCCISATLPCTDCQPGTRLNICEICQHMPNAQPFSASVCSFDMNDTLVLTTAANLPSDSCRCSLASYDVSSYMSVCCTQCNKTISYSDVFSDHPFTSFTPKKMCEGRRPTDRYILDSLEKLPGKLCDKMAFQKSQGVFPRAIIQDVGRSDMPAGFTGKGCQENSTLRFIALDSQNHWMFAQRLGLDVSQAHVSPVVVVFDREKEAQYVLQETFSKMNTANFILNFTTHSVRRHKRSQPATMQDSCASSPSLCVTEINTRTFKETVSQAKDMVLLVYSSWCGFCKAVSHVFLHLAQYFHASANITFARINGETNDLPWEFAMEFYPTIVFFPASREADSVAFPDDVSPTLPNLIRFVLQHSTFTTRLQLAADVCSAACIQENLDICKHYMRTLRSKLHRVKSRWSFSHVMYSGTLDSGFHYTMEKILAERISDIMDDIEGLKTLKEFLEGIKGTQVDHRVLEEALQKKMMFKDVSVKR